MAAIAELSRLRGHFYANRAGRGIGHFLLMFGKKSLLWPSRPELRLSILY